MFDINFYPTPKHVVMQMIFDIDLVGKTVLEPSAGSGNIIEVLKESGAKVLACEKHPDLAKIAQSKADQFLCLDFFNVDAQQISHIDYIVMNPPFITADRHIKYAFEIAPEGCQIIALCNSETLENKYSRTRTELSELVEKHGSWQHLGDVFSDAERKTGVNVALIHIFKPKTGNSEFEDYFFDMNEEQEEAVNGSGIMKHNDIREIVNRYVAAVKMFDSVIEASDKMNGLIEPISAGLGITFGAQESRDNRYTNITRGVFKKELQKSAWRSVFNKMNMGKYVTRGVMSDINKFVEQQQQIPFTMTNIYKMLEIIFGTHSSRMDKVLVEVFDKICSLSADNSEAGEKWKTNSNYKINRRFIMNYMVTIGFNGELRLSYSRYDEMDDIIKALCFITGINFDDTTRLYQFIDRMNRSMQFGQWYEWGFFRIRGYKKGTMHFEFVDENVWMEFNRRVAKIKGWVIPQKTDRKSKGTERTRSTKVDLFN